MDVLLGYIHIPINGYIITCCLLHKHSSGIAKVGIDPTNLTSGKMPTNPHIDGAINLRFLSTQYQPTF